MPRLSIMSRARLALSIAPLTGATQAAKAAWIEARAEPARLQAKLNALPQCPDWGTDEYSDMSDGGTDWGAVVAEEDRLTAEFHAATATAKAATATHNAAERAESEARAELARAGGWPTREDAAFTLGEPSPYSGGRDPADVPTLQRLAALPERTVSDW